MKKALLTLAAVCGFAVIGAVAGITGITGTLAGAPSPKKATQKTVSLATSQDLVASGKKLLNAHSVILARDAFQQAVAADSANQEAQFLYGVTRILALYEDGQANSTPGLDSIREIMELSGVSFSSFGLYNTQTHDSEGGLAASTPSSGAMIAFLSSKVLPEITAAMANLDAVTSSQFSSTINPPAVANGYANDISVDYGDVLVIKAMLHLAASNLQLLSVYGLDFSPPQLLNGDMKGMKRIHDLLIGSDKLLTPINPANLAKAKTELVAFIDTFDLSVTQIKSRVVAGGHLYALDLPLSDTKMGATSYQLSQVQSALADVKASLSGPTFYGFTGDMVVDLSKFFNSAAPINLRTALVNCGAGSVLADSTFGGLLPMGLGRLEQSVLLKAREIKGVACAGSEMATISATPDRPYFYYEPSYPQPPVPITITNEGTANLAVSSITVKGDAAADYKITAGTCPSLTPSLAPESSCTMLAAYQPTTSTGNGRAYLDIASNDPLAPHYYITMDAYTGITPAPYQLSVAFNGSGAGTVASLTQSIYSMTGSSPGSISCPGTALITSSDWVNPTDPQDSGTSTVTLTIGSSIASNSAFTTEMVSGKIFNFSDTDGSGTLEFTPGGTLNVTSGSEAFSGAWAVASGKLVLTFSDGTNTLTLSSMSSGCSAAVPFEIPTQRLVATPASSSTLTGWAGCDQLDGDDCVVTMVSDRAVTATFSLNEKALTLNAYPAAGSYAASQKISLLANKVVDIHYTLDGSTPSASSPLYDGPITLPAGASTTVNYLAMDAAGLSPVKSASYVIAGSDAEKPVVAAFAARKSLEYFGDLTVTDFQATDNVRVKDYCLTWDNDPTYCQWSTDIPTEHPGMSSTLYAFARDEAGNVSTGFKYDVSPQVSLAWGSVYHQRRGDGSEYDVLDVGISNGIGLSTLAEAGIASLTVTGPNGYQYSFSDSDKSPMPNGQLAFFKAFAAGYATPQSLLQAGVYTVTLTDAQGHSVHRMSTYVPPARTLPVVDSATIQVQRKSMSDESLRISWAPVNDTRTYYYRVRIALNDSAKTPVYASTRTMAAFADIPSGTLTYGTNYVLRVEVADAGPGIDLLTNRSDTAWSSVWQMPNYNSNQVLVNFAAVNNRTDGTTPSFEAMLNVSAPQSVTSIVLAGPSGFAETAFNLGTDFSQRKSSDGASTIKDFWKSFPASATMPTGLYTFTIIANGVTHTAYATLTPQVAYPIVDSSTMQAEDLGSAIRFSWANVDHAGALYYRVTVKDSTSGIQVTTSRQNRTYADVSKTLLGDLTGKQWRAEVFDSSDITTQRNRFVNAFTPLTVQDYDPARPEIDSYRLRSSTASTGVLSSLVSVGATSSSGALSEIRVTGPNGYDHELLREGVASLTNDWRDQYTLLTAGAPTPGLYTVTAKDSAGKTATRYMRLSASHAIPQVDYRSIRTEVDPGGAIRVNWAPVVSDLPLWYQLELYGQSYMGSSAPMSLLGQTSAGQSVSVLLPETSGYSAPFIVVRAMDGSDDSVITNDSQSVLAQADVGREYAALNDSDGDGFASNADADDTDAAVYPFAGAGSEPFAVLWNYPYRSETGSWATSVSVGFNRSVDRSTLPGNFTVYNETLKSAVEGSFDYYASGGEYVVTFNPTAPLAENSAYSVSIAPGLKDLNGNGLGTYYAWSFATTGLYSLPSTITLNPAPVTLAWGSVYHRTNGDGSKVDAIDAGIKVATATLAGSSVTVTGPSGFTPYTFADADLHPWISGANQTALYKEFPANSLPNGVYTFTATDANGNLSYRMSRKVTATTPLPQVDSATLQMQRKTGTDNSYRFSWAPVNDTRPAHYRIRIALKDAANTPVFVSTFNMTSFVDVPANKISDGAAYSVRVEAADAPTPDLRTLRSNSAPVDFSPQASDYRAELLLTNSATLVNRTDSDGSKNTEAFLSVNAPTAVSSVELRHGTTGELVYKFDLGIDRSNTNFYKKISPALAPGSYLIQFVANGVEHTRHATLTAPVAYPKPDAATMQAEDLGNGYIRFSWANVDRTGPVYYRAFVFDKITGPATNAPVAASSYQNVTYADVAKSSLGDLSTKQWRVEVFDSNHSTTQRNRVNGNLIDLNPIAYNAGRPVLNSWRVRSMTNSSGVTTSMALANASAPQGTLAELRVTGPNGYSRDLLSQGRWSNFFVSYVLETAGLPAAGLYTFTARDTSGRSATRYFYQPAARVMPPVDYRTFRTNLEADGSIRLSWAPVASETPAWYSVNFFGSADANGDGFMDVKATAYGFVDVTNDGVADQLGLFPLTSVLAPAAALASGPPAFWVTASDGGQSMPSLARTTAAGGTTLTPTLTTNVAHNVSRSLMVQAESVGLDYAALADADSDGYADNADANDANPLVYPFSTGADALELEVVGQYPQYSGFATDYVCATFNKGIDQRTLPGNFVLSNGASGHFVYSASSKQACFKPSAPLPRNSSLTAIVGAGVKDAAGNGMSSPFTWSFSIYGAPVSSASPPGGTYTSPQSVTLTANSPGAAIYYTTDGSEPGAGNPATSTYGGPISIAAATTLKYFAAESTYSETVNTQTYAITVPAAPTGLQAAAAADRVALSWNPSDGAQSYSVYLTGVAAPAAAAGTALKDSLTSGWYEMDSYYYTSGATSVSGWKTDLITLDPDGTTLKQANDKFWDSGTLSWTTTPPAGFADSESDEYLLTSSGWILGGDSASDYTAALNSDGSATITNKTDQSQQKMTLGIVDLSGTPVTVAAYLPLASGAPAFPAGSLRYDQTFTQLTDSYQLDTDNSFIPASITRLEDIPTALTEPIYLDSADFSSSYSMSFTSGNSVDIKQFSYATSLESTVGVGTWELTAVSGQQILAISIPSTVRNALKLSGDPIFAVLDGAIVSGSRKVAGQVNYSRGSVASYNAAAMEHLMTHFNPSTGALGKRAAKTAASMASAGTPLATTTSTSYTHAGLATNAVYSYEVTATGSVGESARSASASATTSLTPVTSASPVGGTYNAAQSVALTGSVAGSAIYYTTDGSKPAKGGATTSIYQGPITVGATTTLKYLGVNAYGVSEAVNTQTYIISPIPITTANPPGGTFAIGATVSVTLTSSVPGAVVYYTTDGSVPDASSTAYSAPIVFSVSTTLKYFSQVPGSTTREAVKVQSYLIPTAPPAPVVTASPLGGLYNASQTVTLTSSVAANVYYTTDGTTPSASSTPYSAPISVAATTTLKYFAVSTQNAVGTVRSQTYSIDTVVPATTASPLSGTYSSTQKITLARSKAATIYYTTDGSIPTWPATGATQVYFGPVPIASSGTLRYFSRDAAGNMEQLQSQNYIINPSALATSATPPGGLYNAAKSVTLATAVTGAVIRYTTDGSEPSASSAVYSAPISIASDATLKYYASDASGISETAKSQRYAIDAVAPTLSAASPADSSTGVALDAPITITFSKRIAAETLPAAGRILGVSASGTLSADGTVWTVIPSAPLAYGTEYSYALSGVRDPYGNALPVTQVTFTTVEKPVETIVSTLSLSISSNAIISGNALSLNGLLTSSGASTDGQAVSLSVTSPDGGVSSLPLTTDSNGAYSSSIPDAMIQQPGRYLLQAFAGSMDGSLAPISSAVQTLRVLPVAGYAVVIQGRLPSGEGDAAYLKTSSRARNALLARGFDPDNIKTVIADEDVSRIQDVEDAVVNWAKDKLNLQPAPLQLIFIDHGSSESFYMEDKVITSDMLADWMNRLEQGLTPAALAQTRYVVIGSCDSGSYINELAAPGRIVITSTDVGELSFRGPMEPDGIRSGEYFLDQFYKYLQTGQSVRDSFNNAVGQVAVFTRRGGVVGASGDKPLQNPLVSINGYPVDADGQAIGAYLIPAGTEDDAPDTMYLGTGANEAFDPTGLLPIEPAGTTTAVFLDAGTTSYTFSMAGAEGMKAWFEVRAPSVKPVEEGDSQQKITTLPKVDMTYDSASGSYRGTYAGFTESGSYDIAFHSQDLAGLEGLTSSQLTLYKNRSGNSAPSAFALTSPADKAVQTSALNFIWEPATDPDGDVLTYTIVISRNQDLSDPSVVKEGLSDPFAIISYEDGLLDLAGYYWQVKAIDSYGSVTTSQTWGFSTDNTNGGISLITGKVTDAATGVGIAGAKVTARGSTATTLANGSYLMSVSPGSFTLGVTASNYNSAQYTGLVATSMAVTSKSVALSPIAAATFKITVADGVGGYLNCPASVNSGSQGVCSIQPLAGYQLKSVSGCGGTQAGSVYTTGSLAADCTASAVFEQLAGSGKAGDCDGSGAVDIAEVQSATNMFLGLKTVQSCVDLNGDSAVSIAEVQKAINAFLGL